MVKEVKKQNSTYRFLFRVSQAAAILSALVLVLTISSCARFIRLPEAPPEAAVWLADPFMGDWEGSSVTDYGESVPVVAQVIALGNGRYRSTNLPEFDRRYSSVPVIEGQRSGTVVRFSGEVDISNWVGYGVITVQHQIEGETSTGSFTGDAIGTFEMKKVVRLSPTLEKEPPAGAVVLFDGKSLDRGYTLRKTRASRHSGSCSTAPWKLCRAPVTSCPGRSSPISSCTWNFARHLCPQPGDRDAATAVCTSRAAMRCRYLTAMDSRGVTTNAVVYTRSEHLW